MAECAIDIDQRGLALLIDTLQVRLQQRTAALREQARNMRAHLRDGSARVTPRIARAGANRGLYNKLGGPMFLQEPRKYLAGLIAGLGAEGGHGGYRRALQLGRSACRDSSE